MAAFEFILPAVARFAKDGPLPPVTVSLATAPGVAPEVANPAPPPVAAASSPSSSYTTPLPFTIQTIGVDVPAPPPTPTPDAVFVSMTPTPPSMTTSTILAAIGATTGPLADSGGEGGLGGPGGGENTNECRLLGPFAIFVQLGLGGLALLALVYKRWRERPQRPVRVWFFDVSKQVFGSILVHMANVFMSMLTSGRFSIKLDPAAVASVTGSATTGAASRALMMLRRAAEEDVYTPNPCSFYLLNLAIDTTLGIPILILLLRLVTSIVACTPLGRPRESIQSGNYGEPPNAWWWLKQSLIYFCGLFGMKLFVLVLFLALPWISRVGDWALGWTEGNERLQIVFVMMLFPLIMNALQYYIIDSFIKKQVPLDERVLEGASAAGGSGESGSVRAGVYDHLAGGLSDDEDEDGGVGAGEEDELEDMMPGKAKAAGIAAGDEYDPAVDGDSPTIIGSSRRLRSERGKLLSPELFPHE